MDLNKLTKKELVEHAESLGVALSTTEEKWKKAKIISHLNDFIFANCPGCGEKIIDPPSAYELWDEDKRMHHIEAYGGGWASVGLCETCYDEWSDVPKGFKLEVNKSNGGLWYRPLSKKEKSAVREQKLMDPGFMIGWWIKGSIIVLTILAIAQFF